MFCYHNFSPFTYQTKEFDDHSNINGYLFSPCSFLATHPICPSCHQVEGAVTVLPQAEEVQGFKEYFLSLRPDSNDRNPWFTEYWEVGCSGANLLADLGADLEADLWAHFSRYWALEQILDKL